jgi:hypothetical protein
VALSQFLFGASANFGGHAAAAAAANAFSVPHLVYRRCYRMLSSTTASAAARKEHPRDKISAKLKACIGSHGGR